MILLILIKGPNINLGRTINFLLIKTSICLLLIILPIINRSKNLVIGFGITTKTIAALKKADGLVVGSALCKEISKSIKNGQNPVTNVSNMVKILRKKIS